MQRQGAVVLFDGLDEVIVHMPPKIAQDFIRELWRILPPATRESRESPRDSGERRGKLVDLLSLALLPACPGAEHDAVRAKSGGPADRRTIARLSSCRSIPNRSKSISVHSVSESGRRSCALDLDSLRAQPVGAGGAAFTLALIGEFPPGART